MWRLASRCARVPSRKLRVERLEEKAVPATFVVTNTLDDGDQSLRWAMTKANGTPGFDAIHFDIPGGAATIQPLSPLPVLTDPAGALIDGYTQPGSAPNNLAVGSDAKLKIELDGSLAGTGADGLRLTAGTNKVRGLVINRFDRFGVLVATSAGNAIAGNYIGTDPTGSLDRGNGADAVHVQSTAPNNRIGGTTPAERNVLSGNGEYGARNGAGVGLGSTGNVVVGNYIGTDALGTAAVPNAGGVNFGAVNLGSHGNTVAGNVISGNDAVGIMMYNGTAFVPTPRPTAIRGNYIGVGADGTTALGNRLYGIYLALDSINVTIGGTTPAARNVIAGNGGFNIVLDGVSHFWRGASNATIQGNYIGTDATGLSPSGTNTIGIFDYGTTGLKVGGPTGVPGTGSGNVFANHTGSAIIMGGTGGRVQGNVIGLGADGSTVVAPQGFGVAVNGRDNLIGGTLPSHRNVISGNDRGLLFDLPGATNNTVAGNYIGTDLSGTAARGNGIGVLMQRGATGNRVGGRNVISGNLADGVVLTGSGTDANTVAGNSIGTNAAGTAGVRNGEAGVRIDDGASRNVVGGTTAAARNVISGNTDGVQVDGAATVGNRIVGNYIGTTANGLSALEPASRNNYGVFLSNGAPGTFVGTGEAGAGNVISGNNQGVVLANAGLTQVLGNRIGTDAPGRRAVGNNVGVLLDSGSTFNQVGGLSAGERNVLSGNNIAVSILNSGGAPTDNRVLGNFVGLNAAGTLALGNGTGVSLGAGDVALPGFDVTRNEVRGNRVENSIVNGIELVGAQTVGNLVRGNTVRNNGRAGVALLNGASNNRVGGPHASDRNVIGGNAVYGVEVASTINAEPFRPSAGNVIQGNYIGTAATGLAADANGIGVLIAGGQGTTVAGNLISANVNAGVDILEATSTGNVLRSNRIGLDRLGRRLGNGREGVFISVDASDNVIGGGRFESDPALGNEIAYNGRAGVAVGDTASELGLNSVRNTIRFNSIHDNGGLGIDLGSDGVTANHDPVSDVGPNQLQNFPDLSASTDAAGITFGGTLRGRPGETLVVDLYLSPTADGSGFGEGRYFLGTVLVAVNEFGDGTFIFRTGRLPRGWALSATATRKDTGDTSEFSKVVLVP